MPSRGASRTPQAGVTQHSSVPASAAGRLARSPCRSPALALARGRLARGRGGSCRPAPQAITADDQGDLRHQPARAPEPHRARRRAQGARRDVRSAARPARALVRVRAPVRRQCLTRAPNAACRHADSRSTSRWPSPGRYHPRSSRSPTGSAASSTTPTGCSRACSPSPIPSRAVPAETARPSPLAERSPVAALERRVRRRSPRTGLTVEERGRFRGHGSPGSETLLTRMVGNVIDNLARLTARPGRLGARDRPRPRARTRAPRRRERRAAGHRPRPGRAAHAAVPAASGAEPGPGSDDGAGLGRAIVASVVEAPTPERSTSTPATDGGLRVADHPPPRTSAAASGAPATEDPRRPGLAHPRRRPRSKGLQDEGMAVDLAYDGLQARHAKLDPLCSYEVVRSSSTSDLPGRPRRHASARQIAERDNPAMVLMLTGVRHSRRARQRHSQPRGRRLTSRQALPPPPARAPHPRSRTPPADGPGAGSSSAAGIELDALPPSRASATAAGSTPPLGQEIRGTRRPHARPATPSSAPRTLFAAGLGRAPRPLQQHGPGHDQPSATKTRRASGNRDHHRVGYRITESRAGDPSQGQCPSI